MSLSKLSTVSRGPAHTLASVLALSHPRPHPQGVALLAGHAYRTLTTRTDTRTAADARSVKKLTAPNLLSSDYPEPLPATEDFPTLVMKHASRYGDMTAMECGLTGRSYTYAGLQDAILRWGAALQSLMGNTKGTVAILMPNCPEWPIVLFGTMATGSAVTTINAAYTPDEVANQITNSGACLLVVDTLLERVADAALQILRKDLPVVVNGPSTKGRPNLREVILDPMAPFLELKEIPLDSLALMPFSSGTSGPPKGVELTHAAMNYGMQMVNNPLTINLTTGSAGQQEVVMGLLPFFHVYGMCVLMASCLTYGTKIVTLPKFDPTLFVGTMRKHKMTVFHAVPPMLQFMALSPTVTREDMAPVHSITCGASAFPLNAAQLLNKKRATKEINYQEGFGMTETLINIVSPTNTPKLGSFGKPCPGVVAKIISIDNGESLPAGQEGELCIHTPSMMSGYHNNREATLATIDEDGWLHTGDVAKYDDEGYFYMVDRIKELIKVKGLQVSPSELEEILVKHPDIADVGVIGVASERFGEAPRAYVVPRGEGLTEESIQAFMKDKVAVHKQLSGGVRFVKELPRNMTGKILRRKIRELDAIDS